MSEYIVELNNNAVSGGKFLLGTVYLDAQEIVRCRDCKHAHSVFWHARDNVPDDWLDCTGPLVTTWDYYDDVPQNNPVRPDGFCAWGEKKVDE